MTAPADTGTDTPWWETGENADRLAAVRRYARAAAEAASELENAKAGRDNLVRALLRAEVPVSVICGAAELARARIYQIKDNADA